MGVENGNGRKWWGETWGKAVGTILAAVMLGAGAWAGTKLLAFGHATAVLYGLPPRVDALEANANANRHQDMPPELLATLKRVNETLDRMEGKKGKQQP